MTEQAVTPATPTTDQKGIIEELTRMKEMAGKLPGKTIALAPETALYMDENDQFALNGYPDREDKQAEINKDKVVAQKGWKYYPVMRAIKAGILRVLDEKGTDISTEFGGPAKTSSAYRKMGPVTQDGVDRFDPEDQRDKKLKALLNNVKEDTVLTEITNSKPSYEILERLLQLELQGENPSFRSRTRIVDGLEELISNTPGLGRAGKIEDGQDKNVTASRK